MKKLLIILTALLIFSGFTPAQSYKNSVDSLWSSYQIKRGEKLYNQMRYSKVVSTKNLLKDIIIDCPICQRTLERNFIKRTGVTPKMLMRTVLS